MYHTHVSCQLSFLDFNSIGFNLTSDNPLVKLADTIPWEMLFDEIHPLFSKRGRNSNSLRMMIGLEIAKTFMQTSDEQIVSMLSTDVSVMYFCGFNSPVVELPDPSSMTKFRNRLNEKTLQRINELAAEIIIKKLPLRKRSQVASDTTCLPANITYPTDTKLLSKVVDKLNKVVEEVRDTGVKIVNKGMDKLKSLMGKFNKKRRRTTKEIRYVQRKLITQSRRIIRMIRQYKKQLSKKSKKIIVKAQKILKQQIIMYRTKLKKIENRIVSFHEDKIRPIQRGKVNARTEFGEKVSIMAVGQKVIIPSRISYDNFSDSTIVSKDIEVYKRTTNNNPKEYSGDRGTHSKINHELLKGINCKDGIQYKGKVPKKNMQSKKLSKRLYNNRSCIEGKIGTLKTRYGMSRIKYKADNTGVRFHIGILLHNYSWYVRN
jgi:hypothetical protein